MEAITNSKLLISSNSMCFIPHSKAVFQRYMFYRLKNKKLYFFFYPFMITFNIVNWN